MGNLQSSSWLRKAVEEEEDDDDKKNRNSAIAITSSRSSPEEEEEEEEEEANKLSPHRLATSSQRPLPSSRLQHPVIFLPPVRVAAAVAVAGDMDSSSGTSLSSLALLLLSGNAGGNLTNATTSTTSSTVPFLYANAADTSTKIDDWILALASSSASGSGQLVDENDNDVDATIVKQLNFSNFENSSNFGVNYSSPLDDSPLPTKAIKTSCGKWVTAQHNLFQFSNICFLSAFAIPRNYKASMLLFRLMLCVSFIMTSIWAGVYSCEFDTFLWGSTLAVINGIHSMILLYKYLPPALSLELTELYLRLFKPLKVSRKHFKELTKEASLVRLLAGETYAREEITPADEKLSILLRGRMNVSCNGTFMHNISCYQFLDSPEWQGNSTACGVRFQVTIKAEEDSLYLSWSRLRLDRILRHRPHLKFVLNNIIGKDITHKMYSLNEQVGHMCATEALSRSTREDHWRRSMNRSVSVDAVNTGTKGHVRSVVWKQTEKQKRKNSTYSESESPLLGQQQCWLPVVASQFPSESPFIKQDFDDSQDESKDARCLINLSQTFNQDRISLTAPVSKVETTAMVPQLPVLNVSSGNTLLPSQPVALIPVIVPVLTAPINTTPPGRPSLRQTRGVKFDETCL